MTMVQSANPLRWAWERFFGYDFFISYAHQDATPYANALHRELTGVGFRCFLDNSELHAGMRLTSSLERTLCRSRILVVLHSPSADRSGWVAQEVTLFEGTGRRIIAVDLRDCLPGGASWSKLQAALEDRIRVFETSPDAPSENVLGQIRRSFDGTQVQRNRIRILAVISIVLALSTVLASVFAYIADRRLQVALSRQLALSSLQVVDERQDLALLLSAQAYRTANTFEARNSLATAILHRRRLIGFLRTQPPAIQSGNRGGGVDVIQKIAFGPEDRHIHAVATGQRVLAWDVDTLALWMDVPIEIDEQASWLRTALHPDGTISIVSISKAVLLLDTSTGKEIARLEHPFSSGKPVVSADGRRLALGTQDGAVLVWDLSGDQPVLTTLYNPDSSEPQSGVLKTVSPVVLLQISSDGAKLISQHSQQRHARIWNLDVAVNADDSQSVQTKMEFGRLKHVVFYPDNRSLVGTTSRGELIRVNTKTGDVIGDPFGRTVSEMMSPDTLALDPSGRWLATGNRSGSLRIYDLSRKKPGGVEIPAHRDPVSALAFSGDGLRLASAARDGSVMLWNSTGMDTLFDRDRAAISPLSRLIGVDFVDDAQFVDGTRLITGASEGKVRFWDTSTGREFAQLPNENPRVHSVAQSPDGTTLAVGEQPEGIVLWDIASRQKIRTIRPQTRRNHAYSHIAYSPDGTGLIVVDSGGGLFFFDLNEPDHRGDVLQKSTSSPREVTGVFFLPDGDTFAVGNLTGPPMWDLGTGMPAKPTPQHDPSRAVRPGPDGRILAMSGVDGIVLWDLSSNDRAGQLIVSSAELLYEDDRTTSLAFSPDGGMLAAGYEDGRIQLWDIETEQPLGPPLKPGRGGRSSQSPSAVPSLNFRDDGKVLLAGGFGISLWNIDPEAWAEIAVMMANRTFTKREASRFLGAD